MHHSFPIVEYILVFIFRLILLLVVLLDHQVLQNLLRKRNYKWFNAENGKRDDNFWYKIIKHSEIEIERQWLTENIYNGNFKGRFVEVTIVDKYKN